jgi:autotransporter-associated beta strand protein
VTKVSTGTLIYSGPVANNYSGITQVSNGTLLINKVLNGSTIRVNNQATVGGTGTTRAITMQNGILSPGVTSTDTAILRAQGNITISSTSNVDISINGPTSGTNFDQVLVTGSVTINDATLRVKGTGGAINSSFVILQGSAGITGTFSGLAENAEFLLSSGAKMRINYTTTQVTLTRVA